MATQKSKIQPKVVKTDKTAFVSPPQNRSIDKLPFERMNYILFGVGIAMLALGFFLMRGPFVDSKTFSVPLYISPLLVVGGFVEIIFAIMYKPKQKEAIS